ncbi:MAG: PD-(D/E)XK nuclease family protein [Candidatus Bipolaricaulota bacterium]
MTQLRISAKNLGSMALPSFCPRCFWLALHAKTLPYQIFPGIFSSIDSYTKRVIHAWLDAHAGAPFGLDQLGEITGYIDPPHHSRFGMEVPGHDLLLTGAPDGILTFADRTIAIIDYKTAKFTPAQDALLPMYEIQLNGYAAIAEHVQMGRVSKLALVYAEPVTDEETAADPRIHTHDGFVLPFSVHIHPVRREPERLESLYASAREIYNLPEAPDGRPGCEDCQKLDRLMLLARKL